MNMQTDRVLVDVFVQHRSRTAGTVDSERPDSTRLEPCLDLHGIHRVRSHLASDGQRILCHFRAPDAESLRGALRVAGIEYDALWVGEVGHISSASEFVLVVERNFERPLGTDRERAHRASTACRLLDLGVEPARVLISRCRRRLLWLCRASTPLAIKTAEAELPAEGYEVWGCE
jgi:hypothetical protein